MHRLFVALRPPPAIRARLMTLMQGVPGARWQDDEQLHITLRFIGEVERPRAEDVAAALGSIAAPALEIALAGVGSFARRGRTTALWAGLAPSDALAALHRKVDQALVRAGLAPEQRTFLPHITLARLSAGAGSVDGWLADRASLASEQFALSHLLLFESHLASSGARYEAIASWPLVRP